MNLAELLVAMSGLAFKDEGVRRGRVGDLVRDILRRMKIKGPVPIIIIKVDLSSIGGGHSLELIIEDNMVLSSNGTSVKVKNKGNSVPMLDTVANIDTARGAGFPTRKLETT